MNVIVAVDKNWGIGKDNKLLVSIPSDMKFFREETMNKVVVMGRKNIGKLSERTSAEEKNQHCSDERQEL